ERVSEELFEIRTRMLRLPETEGHRLLIDLPGRTIILKWSRQLFVPKLSRSISLLHCLEGGCQPSEPSPMEQGHSRCEEAHRQRVEPLCFRYFRHSAPRFES